MAIDSQPAATTGRVLSLSAAGRWVGRLITRRDPGHRQLIGAVLVISGAWLYFSGDLCSGETVDQVIAATLTLD